MARHILHAPPHLSSWCARVHAFLDGRKDIPGMVGFASSGSSGNPPKMILFTPEALQASARGAVEHLSAWQGDWCCPLPLYHVGGSMIGWRARETGARVHELSGKWDAVRYADLVRQTGSAWSSLVPAQVVDLVRQGIEAPACLRGIVVGGGSLERETGRMARRLGWPVVQSYGMTEAASQIATALPGDEFGDEWLPVLPHWNLRVEEDGLLALNGPALFSGIVTEDGDGVFSLSGNEPGAWWRSKDLVELNGGRLRFIRRVDRLVKILGELVDIDAVEHALRAVAPDSCVETVPDERAGLALVLCGPQEAIMRQAAQMWNASVPGYQRLRFLSCGELPRNEMGKLGRARLRESLSNGSRQKTPI